MKISCKQIILIFIAAFSRNVYSVDKDANKEPISLCAKIDMNANTDIFYGSKVKYSGNISYLLFTNDANGTNYTYGDDRLTIDGHVYISNDSVLQLDTLTVVKMENSKPTDEVTYLSRKNKIIGGLFYNEASGSSNSDRKVIYIGVAGDVYHLKPYATTDKACLSHFPKNVLDNVSFE